MLFNTNKIQNTWRQYDSSQHMKLCPGISQTYRIFTKFTSFIYLKYERNWCGPTFCVLQCTIQQAYKQIKHVNKCFTSIRWNCQLKRNEKAPCIDYTTKVTDAVLNSTQSIHISSLRSVSGMWQHCQCDSWHDTYGIFCELICYVQMFSSFSFLYLENFIALILIGNWKLIENMIFLLISRKIIIFQTVFCISNQRKNV